MQLDREETFTNLIENINIKHTLYDIFNYNKLNVSLQSKEVSLPLIQNHSRSISVCNKTRKRIKNIQTNSTVKNETVSFAKKWVKLEVINSSEINQTEEDNYRLFSLICRL